MHNRHWRTAPFPPLATSSLSKMSTRIPLVQVIENSTGQVRCASKIWLQNNIIVDIYQKIFWNDNSSAVDRGPSWPSRVPDCLFGFSLSLLSLPHCSDSSACLRTHTGFPTPRRTNLGFCLVCVLGHVLLLDFSLLCPVVIQTTS